MIDRINLYLILFFLLIFQSCSKKYKPLFRLLNSETTQINFENTITETSDFNILTNEYIFNGGGVAVSDFNQDGLPDLFFTGNMVSNKLYLNQGNLKFNDITDVANLNSSNFWSTRVVFFI